MHQGDPAEAGRAERGLDPLARAVGETVSRTMDEYGFFERQADGPRSYQFRFTDGAMKKLEAMSRSTFGKLFTWE